jgi:hypothetical protein
MAHQEQQALAVAVAQSVAVVAVQALLEVQEQL